MEKSQLFFLFQLLTSLKIFAIFILDVNNYAKLVKKFISTISKYQMN